MIITILFIFDYKWHACPGSYTKGMPEFKEVNTELRATKRMRTPSQSDRKHLLRSHDLPRDRKRAKGGLRSLRLRHRTPIYQATANCPVSSFQVPVSSSQSPVPSVQFPASSFQFPVSSAQCPVPSLQCPVPSLQLPEEEQKASKSIGNMCKSEKKDAVAAVLWPHDAGTLIFVRPNFESSEKTKVISTKKGPSNPYTRTDGPTDATLIP